MQIKQFEDKNLAQYSYAIWSECERKIVLIDPSRNPEQYLEYASENKAKITAIIETHPHADFVSGHLELHQLTNATIYTSRFVGAMYPHEPFDEGQFIQFGKIKLSALNTPGHSQDSISVVLEHDGKAKAVFTGDTLFIGDCGRPDLREGAGNMQLGRADLAKQMYYSLRNKLMTLPDDVLVYPAHGAGTLCGKNVSNENSSTIGKEKQSNWSLQKSSEEEFVRNLLADQPFIPQYFPYGVELNRKGAPSFKESIGQIKSGRVIDKYYPSLDDKAWIIDVRQEVVYKEGHLPHSINLMENGKFETWLGSLIKPKEKFYVAGESEKQLGRILERVASIGYESQVEEAFIVKHANIKGEKINISDFGEHKNDYTIIDVRNASEVKQHKIFSDSLFIPLAELRDRINEIPWEKPIVVHCAGGYRSAAASSLIQSNLNGNVKVFDLGEKVKLFQGNH